MSAPTTTHDHLLPTEDDVPSAADVEALLLETWDSYLGAEESAVPWPAQPAAEDEVAWSASVGFDGDWRALLALELHAATAEQATRELLALDAEEEVEDADVADAVGELANILGGAVKSVVAATGTLTLPVVAAGRVAVPRASRTLCQVAVRWHGRTVHVHLYAVRSDAAAAGVTS